jgi:Uncharacterized conserved protein
MTDVKIQARDNGPLMVDGEVELVDGQGNVMETKKQCYLCRCGLSTNAPYCTGAHKRKFKNEVRSK